MPTKRRPRPTQRHRKLTPTQIVLGNHPVARVAKLMGSSRDHLYRIIRGDRTPSLEVFGQLATTLGVKMEKLQERLAQAQKKGR